MLPAAIATALFASVWSADLADAEARCRAVLADEKILFPGEQPDASALLFGASLILCSDMVDPEKQVIYDFAEHLIQFKKASPTAQVGVAERCAISMCSAQTHTNVLDMMLYGIHTKSDCNGWSAAPQHLQSAALKMNGVLLDRLLSQPCGAHIPAMLLLIEGSTEPFRNAVSMARAMAPIETVILALKMPFTKEETRRELAARLALQPEEMTAINATRLRYEAALLPKTNSLKGLNDAILDMALESTATKDESEIFGAYALATGFEEYYTSLVITGPNTALLLHIAESMPNLRAFLAYHSVNFFSTNTLADLLMMPGMKSVSPLTILNRRDAPDCAIGYTLASMKMDKNDKLPPIWQTLVSVTKTLKVTENSMVHIGDGKRPVGVTPNDVYYTAFMKSLCGLTVSPGDETEITKLAAQNRDAIRALMLPVDSDIDPAAFVKKKLTFLFEQNANPSTPEPNKSSVVSNSSNSGRSMVALAAAISCFAISLLASVAAAVFAK